MPSLTYKLSMLSSIQRIFYRHEGKEVNTHESLLFIGHYNAYPATVTGGDFDGPALHCRRRTLSGLCRKTQGNMSGLW